MSPEMALSGLLVDLFGTDAKLRRFFTFSSSPLLRGVVVQLPGGNTSMEHVCGEAVTVLRAHGLIEEELFVLLLRQFPRRRADISSVYKLWCPEGNELPEPKVDRKPTQAHGSTARPVRSSRIDGAPAPGSAKLASTVVARPPGRYSLFAVIGGALVSAALVVLYLLPDSEASVLLSQQAESGEYWAVGIAGEEPWARYDLVIIEHEYTVPGGQLRLPAGIARVAELRGHAALLHIIAQQPDRILEGLPVRRLGEGERPRLGKYFARMEAIQGSRLRIDIGKKDGVQVGDLYDIHNNYHQAGAPIGRAQVDEVFDLHAWATIERPFAVERDIDDFDLVYSQPAPRSTESYATVEILVVPFDPLDEMSEAQQSAGRTFAKRFAGDLAQEARAAKGVSIRYRVEEHVTLAAGEDDGHRRARELGRSHGSDIVIWGSIDCDSGDECAQPRFTIVDPARFKISPPKPGEMWPASGTDDFTASASLRLTPVVLGDLTYRARRFGDAAFYLKTALLKEGLGGTDRYIAGSRLIRALHASGRTEEARREGHVLIDEAQRTHQPQWISRISAELATVESYLGPPSSAPAEQLQVVSRQAGDSANEAYALCLLGLIEQRQRRLASAKQLYHAALDLYRRLDAPTSESRHGEAQALTMIGALELESKDGEAVDRARSAYVEALGIFRGLGDAGGVARISFELALLENTAGDLVSAHARLEEAVAIRRDSGASDAELELLIATADLTKIDAANEAPKKSHAISITIGSPEPTTRTAFAGSRGTAAGRREHTGPEALYSRPSRPDSISRSGMMQAKAGVALPQTNPDPLRVLMQHAIYKPNPDGDALAATRAYQLGLSGESETRFCIDKKGLPIEVKTVKNFPGDPHVDRICREALQSWRFKPVLVDGRPIKLCAVIVFNINLAGR